MSKSINKMNNEEKSAMKLGVVFLLIGSLVGGLFWYMVFNLIF